MKHSILPTLAIAVLVALSLTSGSVSAQDADQPSLRDRMMSQTHRQPAPNEVHSADPSFLANGGTISTYPNPASTRLVVTYVVAQSGDLLLRLLNRNGQMVAPEVHVPVIAGEERRFYFDVSGLTEGIHLLRAEQNSATLFHRVVVAH